MVAGIAAEEGAMRDHGLVRDNILRRALWASVPFNVGGGLVIAFPSSAVGRLAGLPPDVPAVYRFALALFVLLFGGVYAWLAMQPRFDRPMVALGALGKGGFFALMLALWFAGDASGRATLAATGDLGFAAVFTWWLLGDGQSR
jgi:hypothetical protein